VFGPFLSLNVSEETGGRGGDRISELGQPLHSKV
jgi:hypothetical protein